MDRRLGQIGVLHDILLRTLGIALVVVHRLPSWRLSPYRAWLTSGDDEWQYRC